MDGNSLALTVVVLFEGGLGRSLERWRRFYDPRGADRIPPHVMLLAPFAAQPPLLALERHLWAVCHSRSPIWLELGDVCRDADLYYVDLTTGGRELASLRDALHSGPLSPEADPPLTRVRAGEGKAAGVFQPRVVVAEPTSEREAALASRTLLGTPVRDSYEVTRVHLMAAAADGSWYPRDFFGLDGTYATRTAADAGSFEMPTGGR